MKKLNQKILLELIDLSGGCQQRKLCPDTIRHYKDLMKDGVKFPPIELVWDDNASTYWLWDGFHRFKCAQDRGDKDILANVEHGDKRQAIFFSFQANSKHGLPRPYGAVKYIVEAMLKDKEWGKMSVSEISEHVGCARQTVYNIKKGEKTDPPKEEKVETQPKAPIQDGAGHEIPEELTGAFIAKNVIGNRINELDKIKNAIENSIQNGELTYVLLNNTAFLADYKNLRARLKSAIPFAMCVYCNGKGCGACHNSGFLNKNSYEAAPKNDTKTLPNRSA
jgi:hypothetical protein